MECTEEEAKMLFMEFYKNFLLILPIEDLVLDFYPRGLLSLDHKNKIDNYSNKSDKKKYFLDDVIHPSILVGETKQFIEMLVVMERSDDIAVKFVADKAQKRLSPLKPNQAQSPVSPNVGTTSTPTEFSATESNMFVAFQKLIGKFLEVFKKASADGVTLAKLILWCSSYCQRYHQEEPDFTDCTMDTLFTRLVKLPYCTFLNVEFLQYLAEVSENDCLIQSVKNYDNAFCNTVLKTQMHKEYRVCIIKNQKRAKSKYRRMFTKLINEGMTCGQLKQFTIKFSCNVLEVQYKSLIKQWCKDGCIFICWLIPSCLIDSVFHAVCTNVATFGQLGIKYIIIENVKIESAVNCIQGTPFELFFQYYPYLLQRIHPSDVMKEMLCHKMLSKSDCKIIKNVPISNHMRNHIMMLNYVYNKEMSCLFMFLEILQQIDSQIYAVLSNAFKSSGFTLLQETYDYSVSEDLVEEMAMSQSYLEQHGICEYLQMNISTGSLSSNNTKRLMDELAFNPTNINLHYIELLDMLAKVFELYDTKAIVDSCASFMASDSHGIKLFDRKLIKRFRRCNTIGNLLKSLFLFSNWCDYPIVQKFVQMYDHPDAVMLLEEYENKIDCTKPIEIYPFSEFSGHMLAFKSSDYTVMATQCVQDHALLKLQHVYTLKSEIVKYFEITDQACLLLAITSHPAIFYWLIPKSVVSIIEKTIHENCNFLYNKGISDVYIHSDYSFSTGGGVRIGPLAFITGESHHNDHESTDASRSEDSDHHTDISGDLLSESFLETGTAYVDAESIESNVKDSGDSDETTISDTIIKEKERCILYRSMERKRKRKASIKESNSSDSDTSDHRRSVYSSKKKKKCSDTTVKSAVHSENNSLQPIMISDGESANESDNNNSDGEQSSDDNNNNSDDEQSSDDNNNSSDDEQSSDDSEVENACWYNPILRKHMKIKLFYKDQIDMVKGDLLGVLKEAINETSAAKMLKAIEENDARKVEDTLNFITEEITGDCCSKVAQLVLQLAVCYGHHGIVQVAMQYEADASTPDSRGIFPLTYAAASGNYECFKLLLKHTKLRSYLAEYPTLLHAIIESALSCKRTDPIDMLQLFYEEKRKMFNKMMSCSKHPSLVELSIWYGRVKCLSFLLKHYSGLLNDNKISDKADARTFPPSLYILAVCSPFQGKVGNAEILKLLLDQHFDAINLKDREGRTALLCSTNNKNIDCMKLLLQCNAAVNCPDKHGTTCLHIAASNDFTEGVQLLIDYNHPVDCVDDKGWPPLLYANFMSNKESILLLMNSKPDQLYLLGKLLKRSRNVVVEAKEKTYKQVQDVLKIIAQDEVYYSTFNEMFSNFICANPDVLTEGSNIALVEEYKKLLNFTNKKKWFRAILESKLEYDDDQGDNVTFVVKRGEVFMSAYKQLQNRRPSSLRRSFDVTFSGEPGTGVGPCKEFWTCFSQEVVSKPQMGYHLFVKCDNSHYTFVAYDALFSEGTHRCTDSQHVTVTSDHQKILKFIGKMLAVALCHRNVVDFRLAQPVLKMLLGVPLTHPDDLESINGEFYQSFFSSYDKIGDLDLRFSVNIECPYCGQPQEIQLKDDVYDYDGDDDDTVTDNNKDDYIRAVSTFKLETSIKRYTEWFLRGFWKILPKEFIQIFTPDQLSLLLSGVPTINVDDWEQNTEYDTTMASPNFLCVRNWFWSLVRSLSEEEKALLLKFCTGSPRVPVGGFANLEGLSGVSKFQISYMPDENKIPEAATCFNNLKLSHYSNEQQCRDKILIAIRYGCEGFSFG